jgi:dienelactone hydrolase
MVNRMESIIEEKIDIPLPNEELNLKGSIYYSFKSPKKAPFVINCPAFLEHRDSKFVKGFTERFAKAGYYVLVYDHRAHGETAKQSGSNWLKYIPEIFSDIQKVISWIFRFQKNRLLNDCIFLFGRSIGGAIVLTSGYKDKRVRKIIANCARFDYATVERFRFSEENVKIMSPKYSLKKSESNNDRILISHCKDDDVIPFFNLNQIKNQLGLSDENTLEFETGGHSFKGHREELFLKILDFLKKI